MVKRSLVWPRTTRAFVGSLVVLTSLAHGQLRFVDRSVATGTENVSFGRGSAMVDLDADGLLDLVAGDCAAPCGYYRQRADHTFERANALWKVPDAIAETWGILVADFDNDGDPDVYEVNGGFGLAQANRMLRNDLGRQGSFIDVSASSGAAAAVVQNFGAAAADFDRDGDLDLFLTDPDDHCLLLRNDGAMFFTNVSTSAGIVEVGNWRHCGAGDYDGDGWIDFMAGNFSGPNVLYRNRGDGTFEEVAAAAGVDDPRSNFGAVFSDFDNDGWLDLFLPKYQSTRITTTSKLYLNNGNGTFRDVSTGSGMSGQTDMGHNVGDLDADGYPDVFIGTGHPKFEADDVLFLVRPDGAGGLIGTDVSDSSGITSRGPTRCHGMAIGDYDGDGQIDVYANNGGPSKDPTSIEENFLWQNQGNAHAWTAIQLRGVLSNRDGVGAHAWATTDTGREVHRQRAVGSGFCNTNSPVLHFGLGDDLLAEFVTIVWPSGMKQIHFAPEMFAIDDVVETGLQVVGDPMLGGTVELVLAGPADHDALLFVSSAEAWWPIPRVHAVWQLAVPFEVYGRMRTDAEGLDRDLVSIPNDPGLAGLAIQLQAWLHVPGSDALTTKIEVVLH